MNGIDQISAEGQMYDILAPEVVNDYVEKVGKPCQNPYGYSAGSLMLAKDTEGVQRLYKVTQAINNGQDILEGTNCEKRKLGECFDDVDDEIDSVKQALTNETSNRKANLTSISITGTTNNTGATITSGTFFYLNDSLARAKADIVDGATLTLNTNYEVIISGGLNSVNEDLKKFAKLTDPIRIPGNSDFNNYTNVGFYRVESNVEMQTISNRPYDQCGVLYVLDTISSGYKLQIFTEYTGAGVAFRVKEPNAFGGSWQYILFNTDVVNNLSSTSTNKPLSAAQGKTLNTSKVPYLSNNSTGSTLGVDITAGSSYTVPSDGFYLIECWNAGTAHQRAASVSLGNTDLIRNPSENLLAAVVPLKKDTILTTRANVTSGTDDFRYRIASSFV